MGTPPRADRLSAPEPPREAQPTTPMRVRPPVGPIDPGRMPSPAPHPQPIGDRATPLSPLPKGEEGRSAWRGVNGRDGADGRPSPARRPRHSQEVAPRRSETGRRRTPADDGLEPIGRPGSRGKTMPIPTEAPENSPFGLTGCESTGMPVASRYTASASSRPGPPAAPRDGRASRRQSEGGVPALVETAPDAGSDVMRPAAVSASMTGDPSAGACSPCGGSRSWRRRSWSWRSASGVIARPRQPLDARSRTAQTRERQLCSPGSTDHLQTTSGLPEGALEQVGVPDPIVVLGGEGQGGEECRQVVLDTGGRCGREGLPLCDETVMPYGSCKSWSAWTTRVARGSDQGGPGHPRRSRP